MSISPFEALKTLCSITGWNLTNLQIQKILYIMHMFYLGRTGEPLINEYFEVWDYGPVIPSLYKKISCFGADPVWDIFSSIKPLKQGPQYELIKELAPQLAGADEWRLVRLTHQKGSAWEKYYVPGARGIRISNDDIIQEYQNLHETR